MTKLKKNITFRLSAFFAVLIYSAVAVFGQNTPN